MIIDPVSVLIGAGILASGVLLGRLPRRRPTQSAAPRPDVCTGCEHGRSFHQSLTGPCTRTADHERPHYSSTGSRNGYEYVTVPCGCLAYTGVDNPLDWVAPRPLPAGPPS